MSSGVSLEFVPDGWGGGGGGGGGGGSVQFPQTSGLAGFTLNPKPCTLNPLNPINPKPYKPEALQPKLKTSTRELTEAG